MAELGQLVGQRVGAYKILSLLGTGGMGAVYLGEHEAIGHKAAIKILRRELAENAEVAQRFFNEARAANLVKHSGIVQIFDYGQSPEVGAFLVMEFLQGQSLGDRLRREGRLAPELAVGVLVRVCSALQAAHAAGLIHRDLKPDNIFLLSDDDRSGDLRVKVLDFGIAKLLNTTGSGVKTQTGTMVGTPQYMAPEYVHGAKAFDHRIDVYSMGIIAYEALCGRAPFVGEGYGQILLAHMTESPPAMKEIGGAAVPAALEAAVRKALEKNPDARYQTMDEMAAGLSAAVALAAGGGRSPSPRRRDVAEAHAATLLPRSSPAAVASSPTVIKPSPLEAASEAAPEAAPENDSLTDMESEPTRARASQPVAPRVAPPPSSAPATGPPSTLSVTAAELSRPKLDSLAGSRTGRRWIPIAGVAAGALLGVGVAAWWAGSGDDARDESRPDRSAEDEDDRKPPKSHSVSGAGAASRTAAASADDTSAADETRAADETTARPAAEPEETAAPATAAPKKTAAPATAAAGAKSGAPATAAAKKTDAPHKAPVARKTAAPRTAAAKVTPPAGTAAVEKTTKKGGKRGPATALELAD